MTDRVNRLPEIGDSAELTVELSAELVDRFTALCGDTNPLHLDDAFAQALGFPRRVVHGMSYACFLSTMIGTRLPGPGSLWSSQSYRFLAPAFLGDRVTLRATVLQAARASRSATLGIEAVNQKGERLMEGESVVLVPGAEAEAAAPRQTAGAGRERPVALIAGAGGTLGAAIAAALGREGYALALGGRDPDRLARLCADLESAGTAALAVALDLGDDASVGNALREAGERLGPPLLAVHCASAPLPDSPAAETGWESFQAHFELQAGGLHRLLRACAPEMRAAGKGQFVFISSIAAHGAPPKGFAAYTAAKAAACALARRQPPTLRGTER